jgi:hypothetical protein
MFVGKVGSLGREGWQDQAQNEFEIIKDCSNWWVELYSWSQNVLL